MVAPVRNRRLARIHLFGRNSHSLAITHRNRSQAVVHIGMIYCWDIVTLKEAHHCSGGGQQSPALPLSRKSNLLLLGYWERQGGKCTRWLVWSRGRTWFVVTAVCWRVQCPVTMIPFGIHDSLVGNLTQSDWIWLGWLWLARFVPDRSLVLVHVHWGLFSQHVPMTMWWHSCKCLALISN